MTNTRITKELTLVQGGKVISFPSSYKELRQRNSPTVYPAWEIALEQGLEKFGLFETTLIEPEFNAEKEKLIWPEFPELIDGVPTLIAEIVSLTSEEIETMNSDKEESNKRVLQAILRETDQYVTVDRELPAEDVDAWKTYRADVRKLIRAGALHQITGDDLPAIPFPITLTNIPESPYL